MTELQRHQRKKEKNRKRKRAPGSTSQVQERIPSPPRQPPARQLMLQFTDPTHLERYNVLKGKPFSSCSYIDWDVLQSLGWRNAVRRLIFTGAWPAFFDIREDAYTELTLEVLSTFTIDGKLRGIEVPNLIRFRVMGQWHTMSYTQFSVFMGLYTEEFVSTPEYKELAVCLPGNMRAYHYWDQISGDPEAYNPSQSEGSTLRTPALRYVDRLISQTICARKESPGVVGEQDVVYIHSMRERHPLHIGYFLANFILTQAQRTKSAALYAGHYITRLVKGMGIFGDLPPMELKCQMAPISYSTLVSMHMIERRRGARGTEYVLLGAPLRPNDPPPEVHHAPAPQLDRIERLLEQILQSQQTLADRHFHDLMVDGVREAIRVHKWKILGDKPSQRHKVRVGSSFPPIHIGCFDASHNQKPFTIVPKLTVKLKMPNGKHAPINRLKTTLSSDNLVLQIEDLLIECNELDSIRPSYEAFLVICAINESDTLSVPCQVTPGSLQNVKFHLLTKEECLLPDLVIDEFALEMLDKYGNHMAEGSEVELDVDGFRIMNRIDSKWKVDSSGFISLNGRLQVTAGFGSTVSISVSCGDVVRTQEFLIMKRELRVVSEIPETSIAGSRLENVVFEMVDSSGTTDKTIHDDHKRGHYHSLVIKSELFITQDIIESAFSKGRCVVPVIIIPQMEGLFCFTAAHSRYPEIQLSVKVSVMRTLNAKSEEQLFDLGEQIKSYENELLVLEKQKAGAIEVMSQLEASLDPELCKDLDSVISKEVIMDQIVRRSSSGAIILNHLYSEDSFKDPEEHFMEDVVGLVALLGTASDKRISSILAGYLGEDKMLAVVCKTYEAVGAMEKYKEDGEVDNNLGLHRKAAALGKPICGRFLIICLEDIRPYNGELEGSGSERKLCLPDPILPCGNVPAGFKGYAVNFINQADHNILTATGHGLRETLFYHLFGETQVYETRKDIINARSCIKHGAVSLDGGIIKENGNISLGYGNPEICFPVPTALEDEMLKYKQIETNYQHIAKKAETNFINREIKKVTKKLDKVRKKFDKKTGRYNKILDLLQSESSRDYYPRL